ncbi:MAG: hypothetical protein HRU18_18350 [Pseudoalteromonas sp.]|uniref:DUF6948 domain-containing protein n=1 Tax=Pseudoalteromonas sp. TaxID=53249 RepID=UPI001D471394|nr:hypothetical protein [Pseudoalteromonas sp.]NRA80166.1 hypothetical protein [Pseudoalteromonas sp.]
MNTNEVTLEDLLAFLSSMNEANKVGGIAKARAKSKTKKTKTIKEWQSELILGKYVVVRAKDAGVHVGNLEARNGRECLLTEARRLWYFECAEHGFTLSGVAEKGLTGDSKISEPVTILLTEICEVIPCSEKAEKNIREYPTHSGEYE